MARRDDGDGVLRDRPAFDALPGVVYRLDVDDALAGAASPTASARAVDLLRARTLDARVAQLARPHAEAKLTSPTSATVRRTSVDVNLSTLLASGATLTFVSTTFTQPALRVRVDALVCAPLDLDPGTADVHFELLAVFPHALDVRGDLARVRAAVVV